MPSDREVLLETIRQLQRAREANPLAFSTRHAVQQAAIDDPRKQVVVIGGNWTGKTEFDAQIVAGLSSHTYPVGGNQETRPLRIWYISNPGVFHTVQPRIKGYMPKGWITKSLSESSWGCDKYWEVKDGGYIRFVSWGIDPDDIEGPEIDVAIFDEPPPAVMHEKVLSRVRGWLRRKYYSFTPLAAASDLFEMFEERPSPDAGIHKMAIWRNCTCLAGLSREKLLKLGADIKLADATHEAGCRCNGGYKTLEEITDYLAQFHGLNLEAREWGEWLITHRRIFPMYDESIHCFNPAKMEGWIAGVPRIGSLYITLDPHGARPGFVQFWVVTPESRKGRDGAWEDVNDVRYWLIDEFPNYREGEFAGQEYEKITDRPLAPSVLMREIVRRAKDVGLPVVACGIDPYYGAKADSATYAQVELVVDKFNAALDEVDPAFPKFQRVNPRNDRGKEILSGQAQIQEWMQWDKSKDLGALLPNGRRNFPKFNLSINCDNTRRAYRGYRNQVVKQVDGKTLVTDEPETYLKHAIDTTRYFDALSPCYVEPYRPSREWREPPSAACI